jgi:GNAT superfamily N-acetyltransferase
MSIIIRKIQPPDIEAVRAMHYSHLTPDAKTKYLNNNAQSAARTELIFAGQEAALCLVAESHDRLTGYLVGALASNPLAVVSYACLENILVLPEYRRQGIGSSLIETFKAWAKVAGAERLSVDVSPRNQIAIDFYLAHDLQPATLTLESPID